MEAGRAEWVASAKMSGLSDSHVQRRLEGTPLDGQREVLSLAALQALLRGRGRGNSHLGDLARRCVGTDFDLARC